MFPKQVFKIALIVAPGALLLTVLVVSNVIDERDDRLAHGSGLNGHAVIHCARAATAERVPKPLLHGYLKDIEERLPKYKKQFVLAADRHDLPWRLLAAQAYAESRWDPDARSPTGVLGMMQLSKAAASEVGVSNRLDVHESIAGGAQYLAQMVENIPADVRDAADREAFALTAYTIGLAHVKDARRVAEAMGVNPSSWKGLRRAVAALSQDPAYESVRRRRSRVAGHAAVQYVEKVRAYRRVLRECY